MKHYVVGIGEALWDILPDGKKLGGAPANFAYHISQFGLPGCVISAVGPDSLGREINDDFTARALTHCVETVPYPTGTVLVEVDADGIPRYDIRENVAWDNIPFSPAVEEIARSTRAVCFGSLAQRSPVSRATIHRFLDTMTASAAASGIEPLVVFDVNLRQDFFTREILHDSMSRCNILKINDEELVIVSRMFEIPGLDLHDTCRTLLERYSLRALILTCGVNGSYVFTPDGATSYLPTPVVDVADTVGAGDSFTATFIASLLLGKTVPEAHARAVRVSAYVCTRLGATPLLPPELTTC